jgi:plasmid stabilization system protein ParE
LKYKIRAAAEHDIDEAAAWYRENAIDPRAAVRFLLELRAVFEMIAESPRSYSEVHMDIRRCPVVAFPSYSVLYRVLPDVIVIVAVFHGRRRPTVWKRRR